MRRLAAALPLLLVAACSGGGGDDLEERRNAYLDRAEAVCERTNADIDALGTPAGVEQVPEFADKAVAIVQRTVEELSAVEPPEEDRAEVEQKVLEPLADDVETAEQYAEQVKAAAAANDQAGLLRLLQESPQTTADVAFMRDYGYVECVEAVQLD